MQLFAPRSLDGFGGGARAPQGAFFAFDSLYWSISHPEPSTIGTTTPPKGQFNSETTGYIPSSFAWGQRVDAGAVYEHKGLLFSYYGLNHHSANRRESGTTIVFGEDFIPFAPDFPDSQDLLYADDFQMHNSVETWGLELNFLVRTHPLHHGGMFEYFAGVRYLEFDEDFTVVANLTSYDRYWLTTADNHIVGPQLGVRWFKQSGPWQFSAEGRYLAGFNSQSFHQQGQIEVGDNGIKSKGSFNTARYDNEFSHTVELRAEMKYQLTAAVFFKVGYSAIWMDRIARASNMVSYDDAVDGVALATTRHQEDVFLNGLTVGFTINR